MWDQVYLDVFASFPLSDYVLRDGDEVVFAYLQQPSKPHISGHGYETYRIDGIIEHVKHTKITKDLEVVQEITVKAGEAFTLKAESAAALSSQNRTYSPLSGATLFVSGKSDTESNYIPALNKTSVVTDADGNFTYSFYGEGRYTIAVQDLRENNYQNKELYGLTAGDIVKVHVLPSDNSDSLKKKFLMSWIKYTKNMMKAISLKRNGQL